MMDLCMNWNWRQLTKMLLRQHVFPFPKFKTQSSFSQKSVFQLCWFWSNPSCKFCLRPSSPCCCCFIQKLTPCCECVVEEDEHHMVICLGPPNFGRLQTSPPCCHLHQQSSQQSSQMAKILESRIKGSWPWPFANSLLVVVEEGVSFGLLPFRSSQWSSPRWWDWFTTKNRQPS